MLLEQLPRGSALARSMHGEAADWSVDTHLLALIADIGAISIWQPTEDGHKGRRKPVPLPRPGEPIVERERPRTKEETRALLRELQERAAAQDREREKKAKRSKSSKGR